MKKWKPSPPSLVKLFDEACPPGLQKRKMFGYPCAFAGGTFAFGLHEENFVLRLSEADAAALVKAGGAPFAPMPGRVMRGWGVASRAMLDEPKALARWLERAVAHALAKPKAPAKKPAPGARAPKKPAGKRPAARGAARR